MLYLWNNHDRPNTGVEMNLAAIFGLGPLELIIIIVVIVILFLPALLPKIARRLGQTIHVVKDMTAKFEGDEDEEETTKK